MAGNPDARHEVASAAALASRAANAGDRVALEIYEYAAQQLILLARTLIKRFRDKWNGTVVITGGAWTGCPLMFERFSAAIRESYPEAKILQPLFEPVVGCVVRRCLADGMKLSDIEEQLLRGFADLRYQTI